MEAGRLTRVRHTTELTPELRMVLELGPMPALAGLDDEDLEHAWELHGETIMREWKCEHGSRPWAWWVFEMDEPPPPLEPGADVVRLAELGELTDAEREELARRAVEAQEIIDSGRPRGYVSTGGGRHHDLEQEQVDLWEWVKAASK